MTILETVRGPRDLKALSAARLRELSDEIRHFLVHAVARTGGHLGPNLGVVELTIALHRVFDSPVDRILWDTGHQSHVPKLLTGRQDFSELRGKGGLSGYPSREESERDVIENSHASTALGWADGLATARRVRGEQGHVVAVAGDGALTGGMAREALRGFGIPERFLPHAKRGEVPAGLGLTPVEIAGRIGASLTAGAERREREGPGKGGERARRGAAGDPAGEQPSKETHA